MWKGDWTKIPMGLPGLETLLPIVYTHGVLEDRHDLPVLSGDEVCRILRQRQETRQIPIIIWSPKARSRIATKIDASDYLPPATRDVIGSYPLALKGAADHGVWRHLPCEPPALRFES